MAAPSGWIFAFTKPADPGPIEDNLDPAADTASSLWVGVPERLEDREDLRQVDIGDGLRAEQRKGMGAHRAGPLGSMPFARPVRRHIPDVRQSTVLEGAAGLDLSNLGRGPLFERIDTID
jgi:hypothetical protein